MFLGGLTTLKFGKLCLMASYFNAILMQLSFFPISAYMILVIGLKTLSHRGQPHFMWSMQRLWYQHSLHVTGCIYVLQHTFAWLIMMFFSVVLSWNFLCECVNILRVISYGPLLVWPASSCLNRPAACCASGSFRPGLFSLCVQTAHLWQRSKPPLLMWWTSPIGRLDHFLF